MINSDAANQQFDEYAADYDSALNQGLFVTGESKDYFARGRVEWLSRSIGASSDELRSVLDFGCGTGSTTPFFFNLLGAQSVVGLDVSLRSIAAARESHGSDRAQFFSYDEYRPSANIDLAYCNGVFHHLPLDKRAAAVEYVHQSLKQSGLFAFWENNPWNPGTRFVMSRIPFDRDAITLTAREARRLLRAGGFEILSTDFRFIFPRSLNWLRWIERGVSRLPFGAQYQVLCRKR